MDPANWKTLDRNSQNNPSLPPPRKHGNIKKNQMEARRRSRSRKEDGALKACRECLEELEEVWDLMSLLQSHRGRLPDKGGFHQLSGQDPSGEMCKAAPAGAHQPCRQEAAPATSPTLVTKRPLPRASSLSPGSVTSSVSIHSRPSLSASQSPEPVLPLDGLSPLPLAPSPSPPCAPEAGACPPPPTASSAPPPPGSMLSLTQCDSLALPLGAIPPTSSPGSPWRPAISGLVRSSCPISALSWGQVAAKAWSPSTLMHLESQQEQRPRHPPETSFLRDPTNMQVEAGHLSFVNPDIRKLLEILITKRVEQKIWKEKEKGEESGYHWNSLGKEIKSVGDNQATLGHQHFWSINGKPEQQLGPEKPPDPDTLGDHLQKTCSQLFWGLPFLHSESLVATVTVAHSPLELNSVLFNACSNAKPFQIQAQVPSQLSLAQSLTHPVDQAQTQLLTQTRPQCQPPPQAHMETQARHQLLTPTKLQYQPPPRAHMETQARSKPLTLTISQCQPPPWAQLETTPHLTLSLPIPSSSSQPQIRDPNLHCELYSTTMQNKAESFIPKAIQNLECNFLKKKLESGRTFPSLVKKSHQVFSQVTPNFSQESRSFQAQSSVSVLPGDLISLEVREKLEHHLLKRFMQQQSGLPCRIQASQNLMQPEGEFPRPCQAQGKKGSSRPSAVIGQSSQDTQKMRSRCPARIPPGKDLSQDIGQSVGRILKDLHMTSARPPAKVPKLKPESERELGPGRKQPEEVSGVLRGRKAEQIRESRIPVDVHCSRLAATHVLDLPEESQAHKETENPESSQAGEASVDTSQEALVPGPHIQQELEAHITRFRVRHRWGLPLKVLKFLLGWKLKKAHPIRLPGPTLRVTCESGDHSKAQLTEVLGKPPQPHPGEKVTTAEAVPPLETPLPAPSWMSEETQGTLGRSPLGDIRKPSEAPLTAQEDKPPSQTPTYNFVGRIWHNESVVGADKGSLEPSPRPAMASNEPQEEAGERASPDSCSSVTVVDLDAWPQFSRAQEAMEGDPPSKDTFESSALIKSQIINMDLRRSPSPRSNKSPLSNINPVDTNTEDLLFDAQFPELEFQVFRNQQKQAQSRATSVLLQDCEPGVLLQDCATHTLLKDSHSDMFVAADILASQESWSCSPTLSSGDTSISQIFSDLPSSRGSSQREREALRQQPQYKSQSKKFVLMDGRENKRRPKLGQCKRGLAELWTYQACGMSHPGQKKESAESLRSMSHQLIPKKGQLPSESHFRKRIKHLLQWIFPNKGKAPEEPLQKGKPATATAQSQGPVKSRLFKDSGAVEAQALMTAVGQILVEKMELPRGPHALELNWCKGELQAPPRGKKLGARWLMVAPPQSLPNIPVSGTPTEGGPLELLHRGPGSQRQ
ncbi:spermatogenesis-associated protein 31E1-like [Hippopotamus amphibius kiboko]|uniref:spermatogenesis-associated protein 31E1-like n=1 Tax=Hippopotamus amphibius kiboko TaxID=575201 RepID=UPI0025969F98|nr:spermatogenesis-associated protein 31E1-like [Hippopotamus amphibius kiboko]